MEFEFEVSVNVEWVAGKFVSRDTLQEIIEQAIDEALSDIDVSSVGDYESEYEVSDSSVSYVLSAAERKAAERFARRAAKAAEKAPRPVSEPIEPAPGLSMPALGTVGSVSVGVETASTSESWRETARAILSDDPMALPGRFEELGGAPTFAEHLGVRPDVVDQIVAEVEETGAVFTVVKGGYPVAVIAPPEHIAGLRLITGDGA